MSTFLQPPLSNSALNLSLTYFNLRGPKTCSAGHIAYFRQCYPIQSLLFNDQTRIVVLTVFEFGLPDGPPEVNAKNQ